MIFETTHAPFIKGLENLLGVLEKGNQFADSKKFGFDVLLQSRLAPDQFPLSRQIQIACDTAKLATSRLTTKPAPSHADTEKTYADFVTRIRETISYLKELKRDDYAGAAERRISTPRWEAKTLSGEEYALQHAIPNFYFHMTTAYSILRHNGVEVGKKDYLGPMPLK